MNSFRSRLLLAAALLGAAILGIESWIALGRARAAVLERAKTRALVALHETRPRIERRHAAGQPIGVEQALALLASSVGATEAALADPQGRVLAASRPGMAGQPLGETRLAAPRSGPSADPDAVRISEGAELVLSLPVRLRMPPPDPALVGPVPAPAGEGLLALRIDPQGAFAIASSQTLAPRLLLVLGLVLALAALGAWLEFALVQPAKRIVAAVERFDSGDRGARTALRGSGEMARIGRAFDAMAERLELHESALLETSTRLGGALEKLPLGVMIVRRDDGKPVYANPRWMDLFGIPMDATRDILSLLSTVRCERPDGSAYPIEQLPIPAALRTGNPAEVRDLRVRRDETTTELVAAATPLSLWRTDTFDAVLGVVQEPGAFAAVPRSPAVDPAPPVRSAEVATPETRPALPSPAEPPRPAPAFPVARDEIPVPESSAHEPAPGAAPEPSQPESAALRAIAGALQELLGASRREADAAEPPEAGTDTAIRPADAHAEAAPLADPAPSPSSGLAVPAAPADDPITVLVVEGEERLREIAENALGEAGYRALVTGSAEEALTFLRAEMREVRAVVLDLWIPGPSGMPLIDEILALDPSARVVAASGYRPDLPQLAASGKVLAFLPKPYGAQRLVRAVEEVVAQGLAELAVPRM